MHVVFQWFSSFFMQLLVYTHTHTHTHEWRFKLEPILYLDLLLPQLESKTPLLHHAHISEEFQTRSFPESKWKDHHFVTLTIIKYYFLFLHGEKMDQECLTFTLLYEANVVKGSLDFFTCPLSLLMFIIWHRLQPPNDWEKTHHTKKLWPFVQYDHESSVKRVHGLTVKLPSPILRVLHLSSAYGSPPAITRFGLNLCGFSFSRSRLESLPSATKSVVSNQERIRNNKT